jgi:hypothetical protein
MEKSVSIPGLSKKYFWPEWSERSVETTSILLPKEIQQALCAGIKRPDPKILSHFHFEPIFYHACGCKVESNTGDI